MYDGKLLKQADAQIIIYGNINRENHNILYLIIIGK